MPSIITTTLLNLLRYNWIRSTEYWYIQLDDDERVLAKIDVDYVQELGREGGYIDILPIGQIVTEPIPEDIKEYAAKNNVENTDFYIAMEWEPPVVELPPTLAYSKIYSA